MPEDTPGHHTDDSHPDFMFQRNAGPGDSVQEGMDTPTDMPQPIDDTLVTSHEPATDTMEIPSAVEATPFDYDTYYGTTDRAASEPWTTPAQAATAAAEPAPKARRDGAMYFVGALAAALLGSALTVGILAASGTLSTSTEPADTATATTIPAASQATATTTPPDVIQNTIINEGSGVDPAIVAIKTIPSIVTVETFLSGAEGTTPSGVGTGSGVVISEDGYIATNEHVVADADVWTVRFEDGRVFEAELIGKDPLTDLAVLRIDASGLTPIEFADLEGLRLGDPAVAVGNPLGQDGGASVSSGIVSAFDRRVDFSDASSLFGMIQTDAAINNGSSGGALVNAEGQLIGITAAIGVSQSGPEGIGYAIPVNMVQRITAEIIETGDVMHPFLGVTIGDNRVPQEDGSLLPTGAIVQSVEPADGAAAVAGMQPGDVIVEIDGERITSRDGLIVKVRLYRVGDEVEFVVDRQGELITFDVVLGERPEGV